MSRDRSASWALSTGAGKDATLALHRARAAGLDVSLAFNLYDRDSERVRFHGTRLELVRAHAEALGLDLLAFPTGPDDFEEAYGRMLARLTARQVDGVVYGNIHLDDVRGWYEERTTASGFEHREPLWGERPPELVRDVVALGYRAVVVSVDPERGDPTWLGRELTLSLVGEMEDRGVDPCGERGEYHTFVFDGPEFRRPVAFEPGEIVESEGHRLLDLLAVRPPG